MAATFSKGGIAPSRQFDPRGLSSEWSGWRGHGLREALPTQGVYSSQGEPSEPVFCPFGADAALFEVVE